MTPHHFAILFTLPFFLGYALLGCLVTLTLIAREPGLWWCAVRGVQRQHPELNGGLLHALYFANAAAVWPYLLYIRFFAR